MKKIKQEDINEALLDYCDDLDKKNKELSKRLDEYIDILEAMAEEIRK